jgi:hypothetical protein
MDLNGKSVHENVGVTNSHESAYRYFHEDKWPLHFPMMILPYALNDSLISQR